MRSRQNLSAEVVQLCCRSDWSVPGSDSAHYPLQQLLNEQLLPLSIIWTVHISENPCVGDAFLRR